jgi:hypothetical protein
LQLKESSRGDSVLFKEYEESFNQRVKYLIRTHYQDFIAMCPQDPNDLEKIISDKIRIIYFTFLDSISDAGFRKKRENLKKYLKGEKNTTLYNKILLKILAKHFPEKSLKNEPKIEQTQDLFAKYQKSFQTLVQNHINKQATIDPKIIQEIYQNFSRNLNSQIYSSSRMSNLEVYLSGKGNNLHIAGYQNKLLTAITEVLPGIKMPSNKTTLAHIQEESESSPQQDSEFSAQEPLIDPNKKTAANKLYFSDSE